jgi:hypothetical protein
MSFAVRSHFPSCSSPPISHIIPSYHSSARTTPIRCVMLHDLSFAGFRILAERLNPSIRLFKLFSATAQHTVSYVVSEGGSMDVAEDAVGESHVYAWAGLVHS